MQIDAALGTWDLLLRGGESSLLLGAIVTGIRVIRALDRNQSIMRDYPPHRHINGKVLYPDDYPPSRVDELR